MKIYRGGRSLDGAVVTVDGKPLPPRYDLKRLSPTGFEWTYEGVYAARRRRARQFLGIEFGRHRCGARRSRRLSPSFGAVLLCMTALALAVFGSFRAKGLYSTPKFDTAPPRHLIWSQRGSSP